MTTQPNEPGSGWSRLVEAEMIVALAAVLIGVCALGVSPVQVRIMRAEQHASVRPLLLVSQSYSQGSRPGIVLIRPGRDRMLPSSGGPLALEDAVKHARNASREAIVPDVRVVERERSGRFAYVHEPGR